MTQDHQNLVERLKEPGEEFRRIPVTELEYYVSDRGRLIGPRGLMAKIVCPASGYAVTTISISRGKSKSFRQHALVALAFLGPRPPGHHVAHLNGDKLDNRAENLVYATPKENSAHQDLHGRQARGQSHGHALVTEEVVTAIRASNEPLEVLGARYGISGSEVSCIRTGRSWKHLPGARKPIRGRPKALTEQKDV